MEPYLSMKIQINAFLFVLLFFTLMFINIYIRLSVINVSQFAPYNNLSVLRHEDTVKFISNELRQEAMDIFENRSTLVSYKQFFDYVENPVENFCHNKSTVGGKWFLQPKALKRTVFKNNDFAANKRNGWYKDGDKVVCLDAPYFDRNNCLVISIGISSDWSFDDQIIKYGCKVFAFDHTISLKKSIRKKNIYFYPYGIGREEYSKISGGRIITLSKMYNIAKEVLNISDPQVTYLKIDVEGAELDLFQNLHRTDRKILEKIKQIGMEVHLFRINRYYSKPNSLYKEYFRNFMFLEQNRFALIHSSMNPVPSNKYYSDHLKKFINGFYELVWCRW